MQALSGNLHTFLLIDDRSAGGKVGKIKPSLSPKAFSFFKTYIDMPFIITYNVGKQ